MVNPAIKKSDIRLATWAGSLYLLNLLLTPGLAFLVLIILYLVKFISRLARQSKDALHTIWDRIFQRLLILNLQMKIKRNNLSIKIHGV